MTAPDRHAQAQGAANAEGAFGHRGHRDGPAAGPKPGWTGSLSVVALWAMSYAFAGAADTPPTYEEHVLPIFREKCCSCHNADKKQGGLDLTSHSQALAGGSSGEVIAPGDADGSYLWQLASHASEPKMPPQSDRIPEEMLDTIRKWIAGGAIERDGGKPIAKQPAAALALELQSPIVPDGPPVMPPRLALDVETHGSRPLAITALATSPNSTVAAVGGRRQVLLYDTSTLAFLGVLPFPEGDVKTLRFSRNARLLVAGGGQGAKSGRVVAWDVATAARVAELGDEFDQVLAADVTADQQAVALGGPQKVVRIVRTADGGIDAEIRRHTDWITAVEFSPDGKLLASGDRAGNAFLWETRGAREHAVLKGHGGGITAVSWRSDGAVLATASEDGRIRLWDRKTGDKMKEWEAHPGGVQGVCWLVDGRLASGGRDKKVATWKADATRNRDYPPPPGRPPEIFLRVAATSDGRRLLTGDLGGTLTAFDIDTGTVAGALDTNPPRLDERLKAAAAVFERTAAAERAATEKARTAADAMQVAESQSAAAQKAVDEARKLIETSAAEVAAAKADEAEAAKQLERWQAELEFSRKQK